MYMQKDSTENLITDIVDNREDDQTEDIRLFKNWWPMRDHPFQDYNAYGASFVTITK